MYRKNSADIIRQHVCRSLLCAAMYGEYVTFSTRASFLLSAAPDDEENWTPRRFSDSMLRIIVEAIWKENGLKNVLLLPDRSVQQTRWSQKRYARHTNQLSSISLRLPDLSYMQAIDCTAQFSTHTKKSNTLALHKFPIPFSASASNQRDKDRAKQLKLNHRSKILLQFEQIFITLFCRANFLLHYLRYALNTIEISARWLWIWTVMQYVRLSCMMDFNLNLIE